MAIYPLEAKVVSRGTGRSAVAASAYLSCSKILNDYDGVLHDYTRKKGMVWQEVFLPEFAPSEWKERGVLWNAVEENEKTKDSRLAREFVVALPIELSKIQWEKLLSDFISGTFVADGTGQKAGDGSQEHHSGACRDHGKSAKKYAAVHVFRHWELAAKIAALTEDLEELRSEKNLLLASLAYSEEDATDKFPKDIAAMEQNLKRLEKQEQKYSAELDAALNEYAGLRPSAAV